MTFCKLLGILTYVCAGAITTIATAGIAAPAFLFPLLGGIGTTAGVISTHLGCQGTLTLPGATAEIKSAVLPKV